MTNEKPSIESLRGGLDRLDRVVRRFAPTLQASADYISLHSALSELESLRAENEALKAVNDRLRQDRLDYSAVTTTEGLNASEWIWRTGKAERERDAERARADALAARVEARVEALRSVLVLVAEGEPGTVQREPCRHCGGGHGEDEDGIEIGFAHEQGCPVLLALNSTPAADLEAHDAKVREPLEKRIEELERHAALRLAWSHGMHFWAMRLIGDLKGGDFINSKGCAGQDIPSVFNLEVACHKSLPGSLDEHDARIRREVLEEAWCRVLPSGALYQLGGPFTAAACELRTAILGTAPEKEEK